MKSIKKTYPRKGKNDLYHHYQHTYARDYNIGEKVFKRVIDKFNQRVIEYLLSGGEFNPGNNLGRFRIVRIRRNFNKKVVDWKASYAYKAELEENGYQPRSATVDGYDWLVFFTDDHYYRYYWRKSACKIPNKSVYRFDPTEYNKRKLGQKAKTDKGFEFLIPNATDI
jgi:hypothetical protein